MSKIEKSIDVNVPVRQAYNQWTQFESFPEFMDGVESVQQRGDTNLHWVATVAGKRQEWDAKITEQRPDKRIAWTSISGDRNAGSVDFHRISDDRTRITLTMDVAPSGAVEKVGDALGIPSGQVEGDLKKFKDFIESRGSATGAWRGKVDQDETDASMRGGSLRSDRELTGAGTMGSYGSSSELDDSPTGTGGYGASRDAGMYETGAGTTGLGSDLDGTRDDLGIRGDDTENDV